MCTVNLKFAVVLGFGIVGILGTSEPARAQTTETNCETVYGNVRCTTKPSGVDWSLLQTKEPSYQENEVRTQQARTLVEQARALRIQNDRAELPSRVGSLVAKGKCPEAEQVALKAGDFELAQRTHNYCLLPK
ncbi:hypothetical protein C8J41_101865 [Sphingomonas sp. PP-CC-3G-468]|nr:hypothetical protein C8J41_101865 [Sphingomonas sp. PP-CC-3G-468]